jgi:hypothetical protein
VQSEPEIIVLQRHCALSLKTRQFCEILEWQGKQSVKYRRRATADIEAQNFLAIQSSAPRSARVKATPRSGAAKWPVLTRAAGAHA